jgi:DHA2 family multidrug resistance protein
MSKGFTANESMKKAYQAIDYSVLKQSTVLSDIFMYLYYTVVFQLYSSSKRKNKINPADAMH